MSSVPQSHNPAKSDGYAKFFDVSGQVVIITGASRGLGRGMAEAFAQMGATVYLISRNERLLAEVAQGISAAGGKAHYIAGDVSKKSFIEAVVQEVHGKEKRIDVLVNNAGIAIPKKALQISEDEWDAVIDTNLKSAFLFSQAVGHVMKEQQSGRIINIASVMGTVGDVDLASYCASKGGIVQLTKALAVEWARYNIQVNAIGPGYIRTDMNDEAFKQERFLNHVLGKTPMRRLGTVDEVAGVALFLASPAASYITGQTIFVDGGWSAQ